MYLELLFLIIGIIGLWLGSLMVVESAKNLAKILGISQILIGLTVISIGTSLPEIATNIKSGLLKASGIAIGTNIGSDIMQITFILGITAVIGTIIATKKIVKRDGLMVLGAIVLMFLVGITGYKITRIEGIILVALYLAYIFYISKKEHFIGKIRKKIGDDFIKHKTEGLKDIVLMVLGIVILIYAADFVVNNALKLADYWNVSQSFIGVMIIGVGTGLPELSTAITGIFRKAHGISLGTLIGSNITNPMLSLGFGAIASGSFGLIFEKNLLFFDIPFLFIASVIALLLLGKNMKLERKEGFILLGLYALFVFFKIRFFMG